MTVDGTAGSVNDAGCGLGERDHMQSHDPLQYPLPGLSEHDIDPDPFKEFASWFALAIAHCQADPHAMSLATATSDGEPSARMVLLNSFDERGFVFYTNYESRKGVELAQNPRAALVFYWAELRRQVRIAGRVERVTPEESEAYFRTRPLGSRLGAWASHQSRVISGREALDRRLEELAAQFGEGEVPRPPFWGGLRLTPHTFEFWQSRPNRLHDRLRYTFQPDGNWLIERLAP